METSPIKLKSWITSFHVQESFQVLLHAKRYTFANLTNFINKLWTRIFNSWQPGKMIKSGSSPNTEFEGGCSLKNVYFFSSKGNPQTLRSSHWVRDSLFFQQKLRTSLGKGIAFPKIKRQTHSYKNPNQNPVFNWKTVLPEHSEQAFMSCSW